MARGGGIGEKKRNQVIELYGQDCWWCGCETFIYAPAVVPCKPEPNAFTVDHLIPVARGGSRLRIHNLRPACFRCNQLKGDEIWHDSDRIHLTLTEVVEARNSPFSVLGGLRASSYATSKDVASHINQDDTLRLQDQDRSGGGHEFQSNAESEPAQLAPQPRAQRP